MVNAIKSNQSKQSKSDPRSGVLATVKEAARFLGLHPSTVRRAIDKGTIPYVQIGRYPRIAWSVLDRIADGKAAANSEAVEVA